MEKLTISIFKNVKSPVGEMLELTWDELCTLLDDSACLLDKKEDAPLFNPVKFKTLDEGAQVWDGQDRARRTKENTISYSCLTLDVDGGVSLSTVKQMLMGYEYYYYTTFNHMKYDENLKINLQKFRVILPFVTPCPRDEYLSRKMAFFAFNKFVDKASFSGAQPFYGPSCSEINKRFAVNGRCNGKFLDWRDFAPTQAAPIVVGTVKQNTGLTAVERERIVTGLMVRDFEKSKMFRIAAGLYQNGFDYSDFERVYFATRKHDADKARAREDWNNAVARGPETDIGFLINAVKGKHDRPYTKKI